VPEWLLDPVEASEMRADETEAKYAAMFERRARRGQCFHHPYLGCREFAADVRLVDPRAEPATPISETRDLGWMLYDLDFTGPDPKPEFFRAELKNGVVVTDRKQVEVRG
jgi:CRISPR-associated protein Cas5d